MAGGIVTFTASDHSLVLHFMILTFMNKCSASVPNTRWEDP